MNRTCVEVSVQDRVAHVRLSRPEKRNSMTAVFWTELPEVIQELDRQGDTRVIVLSSTGPHFSSGMDISIFEAPQGDDAGVSSGQRALRFRDTILQLQKSFNCLEEARIPVLAAIQGGCIGAGLDLVTACDMRFATTDAVFSIYEINLALTADVGTFPRICRLLPDGLVRELAYTGRSLTAAEALKHGLVNTLFDTQDEMLAHVMQLASVIAQKAPLAIHGCKRMILHARDHRTADTLDYVALWNAAFFQREVLSEAMAAIAADRPGQFASLPPRPQDGDALELP